MPMITPARRRSACAGASLLMFCAAVAGCGGSSKSGTTTSSGPQALPLNQPVPPGTPHSMSPGQAGALKLTTPQAEVYATVGTPAPQLGTTNISYEKCFYYYAQKVAPSRAVYKLCFVPNKGQQRSVGKGVPILALIATTPAPKT